VGYVVGVLTLESAEVEEILAAERLAMLPFIFASALATLLAAALLALVIARPLRRLAMAADQVRLSGAPRMDLAELRHRKDEIGDLALALEEMTGALADRIDANERFAADVSHEIKNPLTSIRSAVEMASRTSDEAQRGVLLGIIGTDVKRLDRLITDMTRASRLEAETARGAQERVDLARLLSDICESYAALGDGRAAVTYLGDLDPAPVMGLSGPLGQVFLNLIDNARSFSPPGGAVRVGLERIAGREGRIVRATVEDDGPGIPQGALETIFQRFYTDRPKGTAFGANSGLGLSIARQIVDAHEGRIYAENIAGLDGASVLGARLVVELPLAAPAPQRA
jgi:two-component system sensor histidine kinase ChvG